MPIQQCRAEMVFSALENAAQLAEVLFYPEVSAFGPRPERLRLQLSELVTELHERLPPSDFHRRRSPGALEVRPVAIELPPPPHQVAWTTPVTLTFHCIFWTQGGWAGSGDPRPTAANIAYVPELGIEVLADRPEGLEDLLRAHIRFALMRGEGPPDRTTKAKPRKRREPQRATTRAIASLRRLVWLQRCESLRVETISISPDVKTPKEVAKTGEAEPKSVLAEVATNLRHAWYPRVFRMEGVIAQLEERLLGKRPRSALLIGPSGVGKTAAVYELVRQCRQQNRLTPFWTTSGARLVAGMTGFGMWQERCQALCREAAQTSSVVHLGNLFELMQVGQSEHNTQGVGDFLRPAIARGDLLAITECTPEQLTLIERDAPNMLDAFARIEVHEPSVEEGRAVLRLSARAQLHSERDPLDDEALAALDRLHRRYATYSAYPGRPLRFLHNLLRDSPGRTLRRADVTRAFSAETGLPLLLLEDDQRLDLPAAHQWFSRRVIGQPRAVQVVADLLATVKAGLTRPGRPIASLLFIGPTGVGKTEMAKTLAEFLYQDRQRMTRIDMSEYAEPAAVERLIGTPGSEGLLTSKVRQQPFGVVLLDELEKAHPQFFDLLLQVLGEGRLTDAAGRLADFRNALIIMTSNLGSESFGRSPAGFGQPSWSARAEEHFVGEVRRFVRPEMFNRIDRIVPFMPLDESTLRAIARRELDLLGQREGIRYRDLRVAFDESTADAMVRLGFDPRYGARPIKRAIDRHLLAPLATAVNGFSARTPLEAVVRVEGGQVLVHVGHRRDAEEGSSARGSPGHPAARLAVSCTEFRRKVAAVRQSQVVQELRNELYRMERAEQRRLARQRTGVPSPPDRRLPVLHGLASRLDVLWAESTALEQKALMANYAGQTIERDKVETDVARGAFELDELRFDLFALQFEEAGAVTLVVYGEDPAVVRRLAEAYYVLAVKRGLQVKLHEVRTRRHESQFPTGVVPLGDRSSSDAEKAAQANGTHLEAEEIARPKDYLAEPHPDTIGIALRLTGKLTGPLLSKEQGLHVFISKDQRRSPCLVHLSDAAMAKYQPPERIDRQGAIGAQEVRRVYHTPQEWIEDKLLGRRQHWTGSLAGPLAGLVEAHFLAQVDEWLH